MLAYGPRLQPKYLYLEVLAARRLHEASLNLKVAARLGKTFELFRGNEMHHCRECLKAFER